MLTVNASHSAHLCVHTKFADIESVFADASPRRGGRDFLATTFGVVNQLFCHVVLIGIVTGLFARGQDAETREAVTA